MGGCALSRGETRQRPRSSPAFFTILHHSVTILTRQTNPGELNPLFVQQSMGDRWVKPIKQAGERNSYEPWSCRRKDSIQLLQSLVNSPVTVGKDEEFYPQRGSKVQKTLSFLKEMQRTVNLNGNESWTWPLVLPECLKAPNNIASHMHCTETSLTTCQHGHHLETPQREKMGESKGKVLSREGWVTFLQGVYTTHDSPELVPLFNQGFVKPHHCRYS